MNFKLLIVTLAILGNKYNKLGSVQSLPIPLYQLNNIPGFHTAGGLGGIGNHFFCQTPPK